jgi:hypothetical protein
MPKHVRNLNRLWWTAGVLATLAAPELGAQYAPAPTAYSVTQINGMMGQPIAMTIYRDGSKVIIDHPQNNSRGLYDLTAHTTYTWSVDHPENGCSNGTFSGDWGDPFQSDDVDDIIRAATTLPGNETVNGFATKVYEAVDPKSKIKIKVWREPKYGMIVKGEMTPPGGATTTILETKQFSAVRPSASLFVLPPACANAPSPPPTATQRFATETGDDGANFADATMGPGSPNSCSMLMRFVAAGTMQPISDFQVALDLAYDQNNPPHYVMGGSPSGRTVFSGGQLKEYTANVRNGALRVDNVPPSFDLELTFAGGNKGASSALIYRKCSGPQTVFLFVVKNPNNISDGADYMWVKSGKFATVPTH